MNLLFTVRYDPKKGFFCQVINGDHTKCLGRSKGRHYPPMDTQSAKYLQVIGYGCTEFYQLRRLIKFGVVSPLSSPST